MPRKIDRRHGSGKIMIDGKAAIDPRTRGSRDPRKGNKYKYRMSGDPERSVNTQREMPNARDLAVGDKNISYVGDPFVVDGKKFDPAKKFPETYMRPEGAKTFKKGGMARGGGAAIKGTKFKGVF